MQWRRRQQQRRGQQQKWGQCLRTSDNLREDRVLVVEMVGALVKDEELAPVCVLAAGRHRASSNRAPGQRLLESQAQAQAEGSKRPAGPVCHAEHPAACMSQAAVHLVLWSAPQNPFSRDMHGKETLRMQ